jgi:hypothetical protein
MGAQIVQQTHNCKHAARRIVELHAIAPGHRVLQFPHYAMIGSFWVRKCVFRIIPTPPPAKKLSVEDGLHGNRIY